MKIAHFPSSFLPAIGGAEIVVHNVALRQYEIGHQVAVIAPSWRARLYDVPYRIVPLFPRVLRVFLRVRQNYGYDLRRLVATHLTLYQWLYRFDVWHIHMVYPAGIVAMPMLKRLHVPAVATCHGSDIQMLPEIGYGLRLDPIVDQDITQTLRAFDRVIAVSASIHSELLKMGVAPERIRDVPNGVDASRIWPLQADRSKVRAKLGWPTDKAILLTVGRNRPVKGYKFIPEIVRHIADVRSDFLWVIVGHGVEPIAEMARGLGVGDYLQTVPEIGLDTRGGICLPPDGLIAIYKAADIFVCPSMMEAFGMVQVEAMAAGLPVVTTDAPGCRDVVEHDVTGLRSPVGDVVAMAGNILRLLADPALRVRLGQKAEERSALYEWQNVADQCCAVYEELVSP